MRKWLRRVVAVSAMTSVACTVGIAGAQASSHSRWRVVYHLNLTSRNYWHATLAAPSADQAWAIAYTLRVNRATSTFLVHWDGSSWRKMPTPSPSFHPWIVAASGPYDVWLFSGGPRAFWWNGGFWTQVSIPAGASQPVVFSPTDVWAVSGRGSCNTGALIHFNGRSWTRVPLQIKVDSLSGSGPGNLWVIGTRPSAGCKLPHADLKAFRWSGSTFRQVRIPTISGQHYGTVAAASPHDVWIAPGGRSVLAHWNGSRWRLIRGAPVPSIGAELMPDGRGGAWLGGCDHWTGGAWQRVESVAGNCGEIWGVAAVPGTRSAWLLGIARFHGQTESMIEVNGPLP